MQSIGYNAKASRLKRIRVHGVKSARNLVCIERDPMVGLLKANNVRNGTYANVAMAYKYIVVTAAGFGSCALHRRHGEQ